MRRIIASSLTALLLGGAGTALANGPSSLPSALPPVANPGECYAQIEVPAQYTTGSQTVKTSDAYTTLEVTEPQFQSRREGVLTKEASTRYVVRHLNLRRSRKIYKPARRILSGRGAILRNYNAKAMSFIRRQMGVSQAQAPLDHMARNMAAHMRQRKMAVTAAGLYAKSGA